MKYLLGTKQEMTEFFTEEGKIEAATIMSVEPATVLEIKTKDKNGYSAVVLGYGKKKEKNVPKPQRKAHGDLGTFRYIEEFRLEEDPSYSRGDQIKPEDMITAGDKITVRGTSKSKGFQGGVKRYGFSGQPNTHGIKHAHREIGSIGAMGVGKVNKGKRMPGRMGGNTTTVKNLQVLHVEPEESTVLVRGAVPGVKNSLLRVTGE